MSLVWMSAIIFISRNFYAENISFSAFANKESSPIYRLEETKLTANLPTPKCNLPDFITGFSQCNAFHVRGNASCWAADRYTVYDCTLYVVNCFFCLAGFCVFRQTRAPWRTNGVWAWLGVVAYFIQRWRAYCSIQIYTAYHLKMIFMEIAISNRSMAEY